MSEVEALRASHRDCQRTFDDLETHYKAEVDRYRETLGEIERALQEGSRVALPRLWAWNRAREALNGGAE